MTLRLVDQDGHMHSVSWYVFAHFGIFRRKTVTNSPIVVPFNTKDLNSFVAVAEAFLDNSSIVGSTSELIASLIVSDFLEFIELYTPLLQEVAQRIRTTLHTTTEWK